MTELVARLRRGLKQPRVMHMAGLLLLAHYSTLVGNEFELTTGGRTIVTATVMLGLATAWTAVCVGHAKGVMVQSLLDPMLNPPTIHTVDEGQDWTQPEMRAGDRLVEAEQKRPDGTTERVVVLLRGKDVWGYSAPIVRGPGRSFRLLLDVDPDMPGDPGAPPGQ